jgi:hypothetical protein
MIDVHSLFLGFALGFGGIGFCVMSLGVTMALAARIPKAEGDPVTPAPPELRLRQRDRLDRKKPLPFHIPDHRA